MLAYNLFFCQYCKVYLSKKPEAKSNIFQKAYFRKFLENTFCWDHQVAIRDLKNTNNTIGIDRELDIL